MNSNSIDAFHAIEDSLPASRREVARAIYIKSGQTAKEVAYFLRWSINRITGRLNELEKMGVVVRGEKKKCPITGFMADTWLVASKENLKRWSPKSKENDLAVFKKSLEKLGIIYRHIEWVNYTQISFKDFNGDDVMMCFCPNGERLKNLEELRKKCQ